MDCVKAFLVSARHMNKAITVSCASPVEAPVDQYPPSVMAVPEAFPAKEARLVQSHSARADDHLWAVNMSSVSMRDSRNSQEPHSGARSSF